MDRKTTAAWPEAEDEAVLAELRRRAATLRYWSVKMVGYAGAGHPGGSLSVADILAVLFFRVLRVRPDDTDWPDRDRLVLSKGHAAPALYAALAGLGYLSHDELLTFDQIDSRLQGHPDMTKLPGVEASTGSLGQGLSIGCGMAWGLRHRGSDARVYVVLGDGELQEGQVWEAAMFARHHRLDNLVAVVDANRLQLVASVAEVCDLEPLLARWRAVGWHAAEVDGHDVAALCDGLRAATREKGRPSVLVARTIKGKGVSFMEDRVEWHSKAPDRAQMERALKEIEEAAGGAVDA